MRHEIDINGCIRTFAAKSPAHAEETARALQNAATVGFWEGDRPANGRRPLDSFDRETLSEPPVRFGTDEEESE